MKSATPTAPRSTPLSLQHVGAGARTGAGCGGGWSRQRDHRHKGRSQMPKHASSATARAGAAMLTIGQVAEHLAVSDRTVRRWIADRKLIAHRIGRSIRIATDDLRLFLSQYRA